MKLIEDSKVEQLQRLLIWLSKDANENFSSDFDAMLIQAKKDVRSMVIDATINMLDDLVSGDEPGCGCGANSDSEAADQISPIKKSSSTSQARRYACTGISSDSLYDLISSSPVQ